MRYDESELAERPEPERAAADLTMAEALGLALRDPLRPDVVGTAGCQELQATGSVA